MIGLNRFCRFGGWSDRKVIAAEPRRWAARPAEAADFEAWEELFAGYCEFYERPSSPEHRRRVWSWIEAGTIHCLLAVDTAEGGANARAEVGVDDHAEGATDNRAHAEGAADDRAQDGGGAEELTKVGVDDRPEGGGVAVGLAHVRPAPSPLRGASVGFLDDLFVVPAARGTGAFECLMAAVRDLAATEGWPQVHWITAADNARAQAAYDRVATKTDWVTYQLDV
jgi:GNAT superfamily N-acetyltransferase